VIVRSDAYNQVVKTIVVAEVTKNLNMASDPACLFIDVTTLEGQATGLKRDSVVSCLLLATIDRDRVDQVLGTLPAAMSNGLSDCLKAASEDAVGKLAKLLSSVVLDDNPSLWDRSPNPRER
jgi:mRNA-degrading endonuclease toxin of MazEF toxin-antitoxin module